VLSSSVSSDESEIDANSNDDAVDGEHVMLNLSGRHHFSIFLYPYLMYVVYANF